MTRPSATQFGGKALDRAPRSGEPRRARIRKTKASNTPSSDWVPCLVLAVATLALYGQVAWHDFIRLDDEGYVTQNLHVKAGLSWGTVRWALTSTEQANWHPLTWLSHALDYQLFGLQAGGHHMTSVVIHVINVIVLFLLLRHVTGMAGRSFVVAALFAWHPFNVESVAWVAERKNVLSTLFFLLALCAYCEYARNPHWKRYLAVSVLFVLGLAAKPMVVTLPFVLLLFDFWPLHRIQAWLPPSITFPVPQSPVRNLVLEKLPLFALSAVSSWVTMVAQKRTIASTENLPQTLRIANALYSYLMYFWKMFWPSGFALYYPHPFIHAQDQPPEVSLYFLVGLSGVFLVGVCCLVWLRRFTMPYLVTGWLWYLGMLVPVIGFVQVGMQAMADRYAYLPLIGLFVMLAWAVSDLAGRWGIGLGPIRAGSTIILLTLWLLTFRQIGFWRSGYDVWAHTLEVTENNFVADDNMADALMRLGRPESIQYFEDAARIAPHDGVSHGAIAAYLEDQGRLQEARQQYEVVVRNPPSAEFLAFAYANLGIIDTEHRDTAKARVEFQHALATDRHAMEEMIGSLAQNVSVRPSDEAYLRLGLLLGEMGRTAEARNACNQALTLKPGRPEAIECLNYTKTGGGN